MLPGAHPDRAAQTRSGALVGPRAVTGGGEGRSRRVDKAEGWVGHRVDESPTPPRTGLSPECHFTAEDTEAWRGKVCTQTWPGTSLQSKGGPVAPSRAGITHVETAA